MCKSLTIIIISVAVFFASPQAMAAQVQLTPIMDASLYEDDAGALANGSGEYLFFGKVGSAGDEKLRRSLIKFDVSSIPADASIDQVSLTLEINNAPSGGFGGFASLHRVTAPWGEGPSNPNNAEGEGTASLAGDTTWLHRVYPDSLWSSAGGDYEETSSAAEGYGQVLEPLVIPSTLALRQDVKAWITNPASNHGWMLRGNESDPFSARRVYARESIGLEVPLLTVDYTIPSPTENLSLTEVASDLTRPVVIANANDGSGRLFIVEQAGVIRIFDTETQTLLPTPYLDISSIVDDAGNEQGLLGLAFHPEFSTNRQFYVYYTRQPNSGLDRSVVAMYQQNAGTPNVAVNGGTVLMEFAQDDENHNGGDMHFGADGYLYIASGDGGGGGDQYNNAQNSGTLKGKILRIDVDVSPPDNGELCGLVQNYGIPAGNAFPGGNDGCDEILHMGLRNPWKFSFDAQTEDMYIGDVGQGSWEEVNFVAPGAGNLNFGWPCREGMHTFNGSAICPNAVEPVLEYSSGSGSGNCSITGGYVYRGSNTALQGYYVYADYCSDRVWTARRQNGSWNSVEWQAAAAVLDSPAAFGQDERCELYVADLGDRSAGAGTLYRFDSSEILMSSGFETLRCQ